jgi:hypothetical protein
VATQALNIAKERQPTCHVGVGERGQKEPPGLKRGGETEFALRS